MPFSQEAYKKAKKDLAAGLAVLETHLATQKTPYLVGNELTLADISVASTLMYPFKLVCDKNYLSACGNVTKWFLNCVGQDEFRAIIGQVTLCKKETLAPGQQPSMAASSKNDNKQDAAPIPAPASAPAPAAAAATDDMTDRRMVAMAIKPCAGVDPQGLGPTGCQQRKQQPARMRPRMTRMRMASHTGIGSLGSGSASRVARALIQSIVRGHSNRPSIRSDGSGGTSATSCDKY